MNLKKCPIEFIKFAHLLSDKSESLILKYFRTKLKIANQLTKVEDFKIKYAIKMVFHHKALNR